MGRWGLRLLAAIAALAACSLLVVWTLVASDTVGSYAFYHLGRNIALSQANSPRPDGFDRSAQNYYALLGCALLAATGTVTAICILAPRSALQYRTGIYAVFLLILLPACWYNFNLGDTVFRPPVQIALNLVIVFLAATTSLWIAQIESKENDVRVLKVMAIYLLSFGGIFPMAFFSAIWFMHRIHVLSFEKTQQVGWDQITALSGIASAVVAFLNYRRERLKEERQIQPFGL